MAETLWWLVLGILLGWIASWAVARANLRAVIATVPVFDRPVERVIERRVDNPALIARIAELEQQSAEMDDLKAQLRMLEERRPLADDPLAPNTQQQDIDAQRILDRDRIETLNLEVVEWRERFVELERRAAEQQATIAALEQRIAAAVAASLDVGEPLQADAGEPDGAAPSRSRSLDLSAAQAAGFDLMGTESVEIIEGIGPHIAQVLNERGIRTLHQLADMTAGQVREVLDTAGPNLRLVNPATWPAQAALAVGNRWDALATLQQALVAHKRRDPAGG